MFPSLLSYMFQPHTWRTCLGSADLQPHVGDLTRDCSVSERIWRLTAASGSRSRTSKVTTEASNILTRVEFSQIEHEFSQTPHDNQGWRCPKSALRSKFFGDVRWSKSNRCVPSPISPLTNQAKENWKMCEQKECKRWQKTGEVLTPPRNNVKEVEEEMPAKCRRRSNLNDEGGRRVSKSQSTAVEKAAAVE